MVGQAGVIGSWLETHAPGAAAPVLFVGASAEAARESTRRHAGGAHFGRHRTHLARLAGSLAELPLVSRGWVPVGRLVVDAVVARAVHGLGEDAGSLGRFAAVRSTPGFVRAAAGTLVELRMHGVPAPKELAPLARAYEDELARAELADRATVFALAADVARDPEARHPWLGLPTLLLDVPVRTALEEELLAALAARAPAILATVPSGDVASRERLVRAGIPVETPAPDATTSLGRLQGRLFAAPDEEERALDASVALFSAPGESRECVEIARRMLRDARAGVPFDRMAVLLRSPEEYRPHLEEAFHRAGIPAHFARGAVRPDPSGRAFLALLACVAEGCSARGFAEYLSLGEVPAPDADGSPPAASESGERWVAPDEELLADALAQALAPETEDEEAEDAIREGVPSPRRWEQMLVDAAVIGGSERWERRLAGLHARLEAERAALASEDGDAAGPRAVQAERRLEELARLRAFALPLLRELAALPQRASWGDWLEALGALATRALRRPARVLATLSELHPMAATGPVDLSEVRRVLGARLLELSLPPAERRLGKVFVAPCAAARGLGGAFRVVFVPGLAERLFPKKIHEDPLLLDVARVPLGLPAQPERIADERLALRLAVGAASERVVLSYPRLDLDQSRPRVPSFYALEALRAAEGRLPGFEELRTRAEEVSDTRVGWPAPAKPGDAIDDAEHDLAVLHDLLGLESERARGAARYLVEANPHLGRALRFRARRWGLKTWTVADGLVAQQGVPLAAGALEAMAGQSLAARSFSPTALQHYAACPYRFFLYAVHRLQPREVPEAIDELDPLQRGSLVHDAQFRLFGRLRDAELLPVTAANLEAAREVLEEVLREVGEHWHEELAPAIDRVWRGGIDEVRADLREWLRRLSEDDSGYVPWRFELAFGLGARDPGDRDPHSVPDAVPLDCGIRLRGSIDLVERSPEGSVRVTDHKTGKDRVPEGAIVQGGEALQPVLYALTAEKLFPDARVASGRLSYCTSTGAFQERDVPLDAQARASAERLAEAVDHALAEPFLPALPKDRACRWCDYRVVCGPYEEQRTRPTRKWHAHPQVKSLTTLRDLP